MATDIKLDNLQWVQPDQIRHFADNVALIKWALTHTAIDAGWLTLRIFNCSKQELKVLTDAIPAVGELKHDFQSAMTVFYHLSTYVRFTSKQVDEIDAIITDKHAQMNATLRGFFPDSDRESLYKVWTQWASLGYRSWEFF